MSTDGLSARGAARREEILGVMLAAQRGRVRRRRAARAGAMLGVLAVAGAAVYFGVSRGPGGMATPEKRFAGGPVAPLTPALPAAYFVQTDPSIVWRVSVQGRSAAAVMIDDEELTRLLREAGREEGIIRVGGRVMLESEVVKKGDEGA